MKLVSFQSMEALKDLVGKGYLEADETRIDRKRMGPTYDWVVEKMSERIGNAHGATYPLWCWVRFKNGLCPPKHKGPPVPGFDVKITFNKPREEVFVTDFRRYSFVLNNLYIPDSRLDQAAFDQELRVHDITPDELRAVVRRDQFASHRTDEAFMRICREIRDSFDKCISDESDVLQGCVWRIGLDEVEKIELLTDPDCTYGSFNYVRRDGRRFNWIEDYYRTLT